MSKIAVIGGGSFGTVVANIIALNGHDVQFWMRSNELVSEVNEIQENKPVSYTHLTLPTICSV